LNDFFFVAEGRWGIMASRGGSKLEEMIGRTELLDARPAVEHWKANGLDLSKLLYAPRVPDGVARRNSERQAHDLAGIFDRDLIAAAEPALARGEPVVLERGVRTVHRSVGRMPSGEVARP